MTPPERAGMRLRTPAEMLIDRVERAFTLHVDAVFNVAYRTVWNRADAEDVAQTVFLKAATRLDQLDDDTRLRPWLLQIAYRESIALIRRRRDVPTDFDGVAEIAHPGPTPEDVAQAADLRRILDVALASLDEEVRTAVVLRDVEELSVRDAADVMGVGVSAAKMRIHRGRQKLRSLLEKELNIEL